ncbi:MAG: ribonuclease E/G [Rickettsiales bacterium]|jgi:ribonuclease E|nr:ribonuclease E/G [Rickettsiales bacterium]
MKKILIDATHTEETRVAIVADNGNLEDFELESVGKKEIKGNIYLAKVIRVEPSLQAAFVEYGGLRHGFLPFTEIHPDYFQIPVEDKKELLVGRSGSPDSDDEVDEIDVEDDDSGDKVGDEKRRALLGKYKIQEVVRSGQILLIQVEKEERGNKGAAVTTYISLAGSHCVLMPNSNKRARYGISRKIPYNEDRTALKSVLKKLPIPEGMTIIARTAAIGKTEAELKRDFDYMMDMWNEVRKKTYSSTAPALIHEESGLLRRAIRDMYKDDISEIIIEGDEGYAEAVEFSKSINFARMDAIRHYKNPAPLFIEYRVEAQLESILSPIVRLPSGGYLVVNPTEALTAIDVNSGKATKERDIEETALKTNLEAAAEVGRQMRLRDMGGLIVVDFIDMTEAKHNTSVEQKMREQIKRDRAKVQVAKLSQFGLMEVSRQRLRPSFLEVSHKPCPYCSGTGLMPTVQSASISLIRRLEAELLKQGAKRIYAAVPSDVALYMLNQKRDDILELEDRYDTSIIINGDDTILSESDYVVERMDLDGKLNQYLREHAPATAPKKPNQRQVQNRDLLKKTPAVKQTKTKTKPKKGILRRIFG